MQLTATIMFAAMLASSVRADGSTCDAQVVVDECLRNANNAFAVCNPVDYPCRCLAQQAIAGCYVNCPGSADLLGAQGNQVIYCNQASAEASRTMTSTSTTSTATASATTTGTVTRMTGTTSAQATGTSDLEDTSAAVAPAACSLFSVAAVALAARFTL
ncbi:hypothetical protein IWQ60_006214 [Tieghemiomyces parasiticus]|uniref:GPI anchored serine-threonine rich protein n=1 Tax=Tieghemiomyces parasiticus TaxID=78921 RepID=A0A9W8DXJ5_9FUNG|nr:hypothetical protein IWQ60_006214 [Tieghemiomyces parasiticus]